MKTVFLGWDAMSRACMTSPGQWIMSASSAGMPHACSRRRNCSNTMLTLESTLRHGLLPMYSAPMNWRAGISSG